jgi:hypothetical protein
MDPNFYQSLPELGSTHPRNLLTLLAGRAISAGLSLLCHPGLPWQRGTGTQEAWKGEEVLGFAVRRNWTYAPVPIMQG